MYVWGQIIYYFRPFLAVFGGRCFYYFRPFWPFSEGGIFIIFVHFHNWLTQLLDL